MRVQYAATLTMLCLTSTLGAQGRSPDSPIAKTGGSPNVHMLGHLPLEGYFSIGGVDIEQELSRPYVYISGMNDKAGFTVVRVGDPSKPSVIYQWSFPRTTR